MKGKHRSEFTRRQFMLAKDYEVFYYHDTKHMNVEPHKHSYHEFYVYLEGDVDFEIEGKRRHLRRGDCIFVCPGTMHRAYVNDPSSNYRRFVFWVSDEYCWHLVNEHPDISYLEPLLKKTNIFNLDNISYQVVLGKILRILEEIHGNSPGRDFAIDICVQDLLLEISRIAYIQLNPERSKKEKDLVQRIAEHIDRHLDTDLTLDQLSEEFFTSKYYISHAFKDRFGIPIHQYHIKKRLSACRDAILVGEKISEVYSRYGFKDYPGFFRAFKKEYGLSPREYRENYSIKELSSESNGT